MKTIPSQLLSHKAQETTTLCRLLKIKSRDGEIIFGFANLDIDVAYDDNKGDGSTNYLSANGFTDSRVSQAAGTSVDNAEAKGILADFEALGVTRQQVESGALDFASFWIYEVNFNDLTAGRHEPIINGTTGRATTDGERLTIELRSLDQLLKQQTTQVTSIECRQKFGIGRCARGYTWVSTTITAVSGTEADRIFTCASLGQAADYFVPGVVKATSGDNEGLEVEVEEFASGVIQLSHPASFNWQVGDTLDIRQDCSKLWDDATHGCLYHWPTDRALHFDGEPHIPLGLEGELSTPGAQL